jgi:hypothetical protein
MKLQRIIGSVTAVVALTAAGVLYAAHPVKSSDHQDTYNLANQIGHNASADITDVYVYPAPDNANNVVFAMDVWPLIGTGLGPSKFFDPTILWQFKIAHGAATAPEDEVIQIYATGTGATQTLTLLGPRAPTQVGTTNTVLTVSQGTATYGNVGNFANNTVKFYAGPRADPFVFDLFAFYTFLGDRNYASHTSQADPGAADSIPNINGNTYAPTSSLAPAYDQAAGRNTAPSFNGFASTVTSETGATGQTAVHSASALGNYACNVNPAGNTLATFNVLSFVVEVPKALLENGYSSHTIHVWATASSSTVKS